MVKSLRKKFVIVTMILMLFVFGILAVTAKLYFEYWSDQDILSIIDLLSESGLFTDGEDIDSELLVEGLTEEVPIIGIVVSRDGEVISKHVIGSSDNEEDIADATIDKMIYADPSRYKVDGYIFSRHKIHDDNNIIVAINSRINDDSIFRKVGKFVLVLSGACLLGFVTFYLSKYVTMPAEEALNREKRFVSDASHELKTPLGAISINAQALELRGDDSIYVKNILSETRRMNRLIERLLTLSKLEESLIVDKKIFPLSTIVQEMVLTYESIAYEKNRELVSSIEEGITYNGNEDEIRQLIAILLDNAIKNSSERIELTCRKRNGIVIEVINDGIGISKDDLEHIYERFYTTDQSRNNSSFGLGLAIAKEIIDRHDGRIVVTSDPGRTIFSVIL
ncbi:MAG: HAMP domain-containing histidine kinase [Lachnospiraceae bacterium]|nr:HAMP domain-containing histidine kinase [Lachnospiraceae bacterium]